MFRELLKDIWGKLLHIMHDDGLGRSSVMMQLTDILEEFNYTLRLELAPICM